MGIFCKQRSFRKRLHLDKVTADSDWQGIHCRYFTPLADMLSRPHLLIGGTTGSGKSVLINDLMYTALMRPPTMASFVLIDPKRVELKDYRNLPHTIAYASEPDDIVATLQTVVKAMDDRFKDMEARDQKVTDYSDVYVVIDEFADLITTSKKQVLPLLCRIAQLGRAAKIHLIMATQRPTRDIITGQIKVNIDARVALRCPTAQDSRNIMNLNGAERLPQYGQGYYLTPESNMPTLYEIPYIPEADIRERIAYWMTQSRRHPRFCPSFFCKAI